MSTRVDSLRNTLDHLALDPRASEDRRYLVSMLRRLGYSDAEIEAQIGPLGGEPGRVIEVEYEGPVADRTQRPERRETTFQVAGPEEGLSFRLADDDAPAGAGVEEVHATDLSGVESDLSDWGDDFEQGPRDEFASVDDDAPAPDFADATDESDDGYDTDAAWGQGSGGFRYDVPDEPEEDAPLVEFRVVKRPDPAVAAGWQEAEAPEAPPATDAADDAAWGDESDLAWDPSGAEPETEQAWAEPDADAEQAWAAPEAETQQPWPEANEETQEPEQPWPEAGEETAWPEEETPEPAAVAAEPELVPWPEEATEDAWGDADAELAEVEAPTAQEAVQEPETAWPEDDGWQDVETDTATEAEEAWVDADVAADAPYRHGDYTLYTREVHLSTGREQRIYFFAKNTPQSGEPCPLPDGYEVIENDKTGLPFLRRQR